MKQEAKQPTYPGEVVEMPTKELLEAFLRGMHTGVTVAFDAEKGKFVRIRPEPEVKDGYSR